jgi:hypothetical protein
MRDWRNSAWDWNRSANSSRPIAYSVAAKPAIQRLTKNNLALKAVFRAHATRQEPL